MKSSLRTRLDRHFKAASAVAAAAALGGAVKTADATIVYSGPVNIAIPATVQGVYLDVVLQLSGGYYYYVPGWDINPWGANGENLWFGANGGGVVGFTGSGSVLALTDNSDFIDGSRFYSGTTNGTTENLSSASVSTVGFKFLDEGDGQIHYGWAHIQIASASAAGVIVDYAWEDAANAGILAGATSTAATGACCNPDGTCTPNSNAAACNAAGGVYTGLPTCAQANCPQPGACCNSASCSMTSPAACVSAGGVFGGSGVTCAAANCPTDYRVDDGTIEDAIGLTGGGALAAANQFTAGAGVNVVNDVRIAFGSPSTINGSAVTAYLWSDPDQDGNPTDAQVIASAPGIISGAFDTFPNNSPVYVDFYLPSPVTIPVGQKFFAGFVMENQGAGTFPAALDESSSAGHSWIGYSTTTGGFDPNAWQNVATTAGIGFPGNWAIRAGFVNTSNPGACCLGDGTCQSVTLAACTSQNGVWAGPGITCAAANCPAPGACCRNDGTCSITSGAASCTAAGGGYQGDHSTCASAACGAFTVVNNVAGTFTNISGTGTLLTFALSQDDDTTAITSSVTNALVTNPNLFVCTNGFISDSAAFNTYTNTALPQGAIPMTFAMYPNWDDLVMDQGGVYHQSTVENGVNVDIVQWNLARPFAGGAPVANGSFEVKIFGPGGPGLAQYIFQGDDSWDWNGNSSTVGVQWSPTKSFQYSFGNTSATTTPPFPIPDGSVFTVKAAGSACYANCDSSTQVPFLNVGDFTCFLQKFASGAAYANCDNSTQAPVLNVGDFTCFLQKFASGCSAP